MRKLCVTAMAVVALGGAAAAPGAVASSAPVAAIAKTCGHGYTHAVIGGRQKCLRRGEFCSYAERNQYHRYGFNCVLLKPSETYHLEPRG